VVIDGLISAVAALTADRLVPGCRQYMLPSHTGREKGIAVIMDELSLKPVIHADLALGEGTGAILLFPMLDMAMTLFNEGTAFGDTEIDQYERFD
jgi:nicotinate-nucleotide--dimethylbenzimidazole phosphoribosyltransferase